MFVQYKSEILYLGGKMKLESKCMFSFKKMHMQMSSSRKNVLGISYFIVFLNLKFVLTHLLDKIETKLLMTLSGIFFNKNRLVLKSVSWGSPCGLGDPSV